MTLPQDLGGLGDLAARIRADLAPIGEVAARLSASLDASLTPLQATLRKLDLVALEESMRKQRAARANPDNPKSFLWLATGHLTPRERAPHEHFFPDPTKPGPGRPRGTGRVATNKPLLLEMRRLVDGGMKRYAAALKLTNSPGAARHLVRVFDEWVLTFY